MEQELGAWRAKVAVVGSVLCLAVAVVDHLSGSQVSFLFFYLVPIAAIGWRVGGWVSLVVALVATLSRYGVMAVDAPRLLDPLLLWNTFNRGLVFVAVALLSEMLGRQSLLARTDPLTGLPNRRALIETLRAQCRRREGVVGPLCVAFVDLDDFKTVNDRYGHAAGDLVLRRSAEILRSAVRLGDLVARIGGDEFVVVCWRVPANDAREMALRLVERIAAMGLSLGEGSFGASVGVAHYVEVPRDVNRMLEEADTALLEAKTRGKGQAVVRELSPIRD